MDRERKHRIQDCRRHDIQQSATFLEPGRLPRFYHRMGFVPVKTVRGEYVFEIPAQISDCAGQLWWVETSFVLQNPADAVAHFLFSSLEKQGVGDFIFAQVFNE